MSSFQQPCMGKAAQFPAPPSECRAEAALQKLLLHFAAFYICTATAGAAHYLGSAVILRTHIASDLLRIQPGLEICVLNLHLSVCQCTFFVED